MPDGIPSPWAYHGPDTKLITLALPPEFWPKERLTRGRVSTWLGNLDWKRAEKHGLKKLAAPLHRRCNQPFRHVATKWDGQLRAVRLDFLGESAHLYPNVKDGAAGFKRFWFGDLMQGLRRELRNGNRAAISECSRWNVFGRADIVWPAKAMEQYWDGEAWRTLPE